MSSLSDLRELLDHLEAASLIVEGLDSAIPASLYEAEGVAIDNLINRFTTVLAEKEQALAVAAGLPAAPPPAPLTQEAQRCQSIYRCILDYKQHHDGNTPTMRQIAQACRIPSTSMVFRYLSIMQAEGFISLTPDASRSIHVRGAVWLPPSFS